MVPLFESPALCMWCIFPHLFFASSSQFRMQFICLLVGMWSLRNVRRQRVVSASLFDQRRMRSQGNSSVGGSVVHGSSSMSNGNHSSRLRKKPMDSSVELTQQQHHQQNYLGYGKVPKSPAPDFNGQDSDMQTVWNIAEENQCWRCNQSSEANRRRWWLWNRYSISSLNSLITDYIAVSSWHRINFYDKKKMSSEFALTNDSPT